MKKETADPGNTHPRRDAPAILVLLLVSAWPLLNFANVNRDKAFSIPIVLAFFAISFTVTMVVYGLCRWLIRRVPPGSWALALAAGHVLFFGHAVVLPRLGRAIALAGLPGGRVTLAAAVIVIVLSAALLGSRRLAVTAVAVGLAVAMATPAAGLTRFAIGQWQAARRSPAPSTRAQGTLRFQPNIYFVMADGYGRSDSLQRFLGFDNRAAIAELEGLGFFVARNARANYPMTFLAMSSVLNMDYVATPDKPPYPDRSGFTMFLRGENAVFNQFKQLGYSVVQAGSGLWKEFGCWGFEDVCIEEQTFGAGEVFRLGFGETETALMEMTPLFKRYIAAARTRGVFGEAVTNFAGLTKALRTVDLTRPVLVLAHSFPPHPPFIYSADCSIRGEVVYDYGPLRDRADDPAGRERYRQLSAEAAECVTSQMLFFAREITRRDPGAIVVIQSDHGSDTRVDWSPRTPLNSWTREARQERFGVLNAIRLPIRCRQWLTDEISPVNTFRLVMGCLQDRRPDLLPDRSFVAAYENHSEFGRLSEIVEP